MKKFFKWVFILIATFYGVIFLKDIFDKRPIRFEDFDNDESFESFLLGKYPLGSNIDDFIKALEVSGAECEFIQDESRGYYGEPKERAKFYATCEYSGNFFSRNFFGWYRVIVYSNKDRKMIHLFTERSTKFII